VKGASRDLTGLGGAKPWSGMYPRQHLESGDPIIERKPSAAYRRAIPIFDRQLVTFEEPRNRSFSTGVIVAISIHLESAITILVQVGTIEPRDFGPFPLEGADARRVALGIPEKEGVNTSRFPLVHGAFGRSHFAKSFQKVRT
jgi:hypothetical protein